MPLLADAVGFAEPREDFVVQRFMGSEAEEVDVIPRRNRFDLGKTRMLESASEDDVSDETIAPQGYGSEAHSDLKGDARLFGYDAYRTATLHQPCEFAE
jgi:hypothetical protein